jgi:hypothetical protein
MHYVRNLDMFGRFIAYGLPVSPAKALAEEISKWETNSGPVWTVNRLKSLKQDLIRLHAGMEPLTWVRLNRNGGWYGVLGFVKRYATQSLNGLEIVLNCLMYYSSLMPSEPTKEHIQKLKASVESPGISISGQLCDEIAHHAQKIIGKLELGKPQPLLTFRGKVKTKAPIYGSTSVSQYDYLEKELDWLKNPYHMLFLNRHYTVYSKVLEGISNLSLCEPLMGLSGQSYHLSDHGPFETVHSRLRPPFMACAAGSLVPLTKDGGWKVRWIASPYRIHQLALKPLGSALFKALSKLPWDCTFDQEKPYSFVQEHLKNGGVCHAVDLSAATDYFPLSLQLSVLRSIFGKVPDIDLFEELSRSDWTNKTLGLEVRWTNGQPMGLYPSFPSFALTHGILLDFLSEGRPNTFFVLGDDVIILDGRVYTAYMEMLKTLGCPHNPDKSIVSSGVTEFAGKIITPERIVSAFKWRDVGSENFMDLMRTFGQRFEPMLRRRERRVYHALKRFLQPHGCNHSSGASEPLEKVSFDTEVFESGLPEARGRVCHTSFLHRLAELAPDRPDSLFHKVCWSWFKKQSDRLDERTITAFENTPFRKFPGDRGLLADILEVNDTIVLPTVGPTIGIGHTTSLEFYEKMLGFSE